MEQQWIEYLRKRFADRKAAPPDGLWEAVQAAMNGVPAGNGSAEKRRRRAAVVPMWRRRAVAVAACVVVLAATVWYFSVRRGVPYSAVGVAPAVEVSAGGLAKATVPAADGGVLQSAAAAVRRVVLVAAALDGGGPSVVQPSADSVAVAVADETGCGDAAEERRGHGGESVVVRREPSRDGSRGGEGRNLLASADGVRTRGGGVSVSLYGGGFTSIGGSTGNTGASFRPYTMLQDGSQDDGIMLLSAVTGSREAAEVRVKHRHPVKVGASVRFDLPGRFGVETGMNYSYHSSDIASGDDSGGYFTEQKLHYVGIPVAVSYDIWHTDFLEVYASAGGAVEFCVSGKSHTETKSGNAVVAKTDADVRDGRPQWSVGASAGVQYNVSDVVGVYVEPGVSYYFDNGSGVSTIYKDKPFNFNLNVGLRFTVR